jgi:RecA/RadA recombinase
MPIDPVATAKRLARIEQMIEKYRADQRRQLLQQANKFRRLSEAHKTLMAFDVQRRLH